jgi:hypothetical protein
VTEHPDILLAEYVDGTLDPAARAEVESHLAGCSRCREELALAGEARRALAGLDEVPAPEGLTFAVRRRAQGQGPSRTGRWVAATAAAAVLIAGVVVAIGQLGVEERGTAGGDLRRGEQEQAPAAEGGGATQPKAAESGAQALDRTSLPTYTETDRDYDQQDLVTLGRRYRNGARAAIEAGLPPTATGFFGNFDLAAFTGPVRQAIECSIREVPPEQLLVPFSIEAASFNGRPAYVTAFLQGPTPDLPYDRVVIWVVDRETCGLASLATQRL